MTDNNDGQFEVQNVVSLGKTLMLRYIYDSVN